MMMWEKQTEEQLNHELSEKEDLIAQLHEKDRIMEMLQENLKKCNQEKDDYTQLIFQLQHKGKFLDEDRGLKKKSYRLYGRQQSTIMSEFSSDDDADEEMINAKQLQNRLISKEIKALKGKLVETEKDLSTIKTNSSHTNEANTDKDITINQCNSDKFEIELKNKSRNKTEHQQDVLEIEKHIGVLCDDVKKVNQERNRIKDEVNFCHEYVDALNELFAHVWGNQAGSSSICKGKASKDLEMLFTENCQLMKQFQAEKERFKTEKMQLKHAKSKASKSRSRNKAQLSGLLSLNHVKTTLRILKNNKKSFEEGNVSQLVEYLQKLCVVLLETLEEREKIMCNQKKMKHTLIERADYLEGQCDVHNVPLKQKDDATKKGGLNEASKLAADKSKFDEQFEKQDDDEVHIHVEFEQPISLLNSNYIPPSEQI